MAIDGFTFDMLLYLKFLGVTTQDFDDAQANIDEPYRLSWTVGVGANQFNQLWTDQRTLGAGSRETLDWQSGLTNRWQQSVVFKSIKLLYIRNRSSSGHITIGGPAFGFVAPWSAPFGDVSDKLVIRPLGMAVLATTHVKGFTVLSSSKELTIANGDAADALLYDIMVGGVE